MSDRSAEDQLIALGRRCLQIESAALATTGARLDGSFAAAVRAILATTEAEKKLLLSAVGKNRPIAEKLAGTFNSTGVRACFLDPVQALHGDLGLCAEGDLALLLSNSGETEELVRLVPLLRRLGARTLALTSEPASALAAASDQLLAYRIDREACPLNLAPTASTTAALALGDALAMVSLELRGFSREDFARFHPSGSLGKALLLRARDIMRSGERFASMPANGSVKEALLAITKAKCGLIALTDPDNGQLAGVFSDGDFRRAALRDEWILQRPVADYLTPNPKCVREDAFAAEVLRTFEQTRVNDLLVTDAQDRPVGLIDGQDLPRLKLV